MSKGPECIFEGRRSLERGSFLNVARLITMISLALMTVLGCNAPYQGSVIRLKDPAKDKELTCLLQEFNRRTLMEMFPSDWAEKNCNVGELADIPGDLTGVKKEKDKVIESLGLDGLVKWTGGGGNTFARQEIDCGVFGRLSENSKAGIGNPDEIDRECGYER